MLSIALEILFNDFFNNDILLAFDRYVKSDVSNFSRLNNSFILSKIILASLFNKLTFNTSSFIGVKSITCFKSVLFNTIMCVLFFILLYNSKSSLVSGSLLFNKNIIRSDLSIIS